MAADTRAVLTPVVCPIIEGDWESVRVLVSKADRKIRQVALSQHAWSQLLDCDAGECPLSNGHPEVYVSLNSHANYATASPAYVYAQVP